MAIRYEWSASKAQSNIRKHGVSFETAIRVFADPLHVSEQDRIEGGEQRWRTIGIVDGTRLLLVAHLWMEDDGDEVVRIISARPATRAERKHHER